MIINLFKKMHDNKTETTKPLKSVDSSPWKHTFLNANILSQFRDYSEKIWLFATEYSVLNNKPLDCAFNVNMAQNMYKWANLSQKYGASSTLYCHPQDTTAISQPEWEEYDGEYHDIFNGAGFQAVYPQIKVAVPSVTVPMGDSGFLQAIVNYKQLGDWAGLHKMLTNTPMFPESFLAYEGYYPYWNWARAMEKHQVIYTCSDPIAAYFSARPYCFFSVGGDLQFDCGLGGDKGMLMRLAVNRAKFIFVSNPHTLGHCRRLGFTNAVYLPYPMDSNHYCPGKGVARKSWESLYGSGLYILTTSRIDKGVKGHDQSFINALFSLAKLRENVRFIFLGWGHDIEEFRQKIAAQGLQKQMIILPPVGKKRLIDYYRSCDIVLDQFVYGYYGATALEAASIGKPVVMKIRAEQYAPLYNGDVAPVENVDNSEEMQNALLKLIDNEAYRLQKGVAMREWLVRNHGEEKTVPLMLALLRLAADNVPLPASLTNPLDLPLSEEEVAYHQNCLQ